MSALFKLWSAVQAVKTDAEMGPEFGELGVILEHLEAELRNVLHISSFLPPSPVGEPVGHLGEPVGHLGEPVGGAVGPFSATSDEDLQVIVSAANAHAKAKAKVTKPRPNYNHPIWPSPIPQVLAREMCGRRLIYEDALKFLAMRTGKTVEDFLKLTKREYVDKFSHAVCTHGALRRCGRRAW